MLTRAARSRPGRLADIRGQARPRDPAAGSPIPAPDCCRDPAVPAARLFSRPGCSRGATIPAMRLSPPAAWLRGAVVLAVQLFCGATVPAVQLSPRCGCSCGAAVPAARLRRLPWRDPSVLLRLRSLPDRHPPGTASEPRPARPGPGSGDESASGAVRCAPEPLHPAGCGSPRWPGI